MSSPFWRKISFPFRASICRTEVFGCVIYCSRSSVHLIPWLCKRSYSFKCSIITSFPLLSSTTVYLLNLPPYTHFAKPVANIQPFFKFHPSLWSPGARHCLCESESESQRACQEDSIITLWWQHPCFFLCLTTEEKGLKVKGCGLLNNSSH